jgi:hypothetical protein
MSYSRREKIQLTYQREKIQRDKTKLCLRRTTKTYLKKLGRNDLFKSYLQRACNSTRKRHGLLSRLRAIYISSCITNERLVRRGCILRHSYCHWYSGTGYQDIHSPFFIRRRNYLPSRAYRYGGVRVAHLFRFPFFVCFLFVCCIFCLSLSGVLCS